MQAVRIKEEQRSLTKEQREAVGLLSIGTFLEYFDLMLYVHMAVLLNELFFEKTDPHTATVITAFAFCSTYLLRPIGALIFGWIGDNIGRKVTVIITTMMMAISCIVMANLPTYAQIGISASWVVTICRIMQGMSSMGEITGAQLYLTETIHAPARYPAVATMNLCAALGTFIALGVAFLVTSFGLNWRIAFWVGAGVAGIGMVARTKLRETADFVDARHKYKEMLENFKIDSAEPLIINPIVNPKVSLKTSLSLLLMDCMWPVCFYFAYIHCANVLKHSFNYSAEQIIFNNFITSGVQVLNVLIVIALSYKVYPLLILKVKLILSSLVLIATPFLLNNAQSGLEVLAIQSLMLFLACDASPANAIFFKHFPVFKRFTYTSVIYAISRAVIYAITSFGLIYLTKYFGNYGILFIIIPVILGCAYGLSHFIKLEKKAGNYPNNLCKAQKVQ